jgi:hypothetical protein
MGNVGVNFGGGAGAEFAMENVPENWKPLAGMAGGIGGAGLAQLAGATAKAFPKMGSAAFEYMRPSFNPEAEAARRFADKTIDRRAVLDAIEGADRELVPGSKPTTFELTGDTGIGQQQRQAETRAPDKFLERRGEQATARQESLEGIAPSGDPMDVTALLANNTFSAVVLHEMAHVLGFGTLWNTTSIGGTRNVTQGQGTGNPRFTGARAVAEWSRLGGLSSVPLENTGGAGTVGSHWKESTFGIELMTGYISPTTNPLSRLSIAQFADLGYNVDISKADSYSVPGFGLLRSAMQQDAPIEGVMLAPPINTTP